MPQKGTLLKQPTDFISRMLYSTPGSLFRGGAYCGGRTTGHTACFHL